MKGKVVRIAIILAILVAGMSMAAMPGAAQSLISSATLHINGELTTSPLTVRAHQVLETWEEETVTWNTQPAYDGAVAGSD